jgi:hypothetical protein
MQTHEYTDEERLAAYRKVLADIKREEGAALLGQVDRYSYGNDVADTDAGLGQGMMALDLATSRPIQPQPSDSPHLNPESANFQPQGWNENGGGVSASNLAPPQVWNKPTATVADSANVDNAFVGSGLGNGAISPPRISTARRVNVAGSSTLGPAPTFQLPARPERRAVNITNLDGTPLSFHAPNTGSPTPRRNSLMEQALMGGSTGSPHRQGGATTTGATPNSYPATPRRHSDAPVLMPSVGRPSPGHIRNYGMGSTVTFGVVGSGSPYSSPNRAMSPVRSVVGTPLASGIGMAAGMMMSPSRAPVTGVATGRGGYVDTPRPVRQGHTRTQSRSTLSVSETITEEGDVHDNTVGKQREY